MPNLKTFHLDRLSFRQQIFAMFFGVMVIIAPISSYIMSTTSSDTLIKQANEQGIQVARTLANQSKLALLYESEFTAQESVAFVSGFPDVEVLEVRLADGRALYKSESWSKRNFHAIHSNDDKELHSYELDDEWIYVLPVISSQGADDTLDIIEEESEQVLLGYVTVAMSKQTLILLQRKAFVTNLLLSLGMAGIASILLLQLARRVTKPIEKLARTMQLAEQGDKGVRAEHKGQPDVTIMQHAFNAMMDVLEKREAELELARDNAIENARVKGEFAANVTHELRTPMNAVLGMLDLLQHTQLSTRQSGYVEVAQNSGENLLTLIDDILDFSKMDAKKVIANKTDHDLKELLEDVIRLLASQSLSKNIDIGYLLQADLPSSVSLDRSRVQQVLINLIGNAIKFTEAGEVYVIVSIKAGQQNNSQATLLFEVIDSGIGISQDKQKSIFEAFTQADASTTREYAGTGLGLTISKQIVELMDGKIGLNSQAGNGATFWFTLPVAMPSVKTSSPKSVRDNVVIDANKKCLLVAQSPIIQQFTEQTLARRGISCTFANNFSEAAELLTIKHGASSLFDHLIIDKDLYCNQQGRFETLLSAYLETSARSITMLVNPFNTSAVNTQQYIEIEKPLIRSSFAEIFNSNRSKSVDRELPSGQQEPHHRYNGTKILVVDDNRVNQEVAKEMLSNFGCHSDIAADGQQAMEMVLKTRYDLILMDCNMPVMDGYDCTREIRQLEGTEQTPIIAMTANDSASEREHCTQAGMNSFLAKPLRLGSLKTEISRWLKPDIASQQSDMAVNPNAGNDTASNYDNTVISELFGSIGDVVYRMIEAFIEDTPVYIDSLKSALVEEDAKQARELAHTIKGSAANFGAHRLVETAKTIEQLALNEHIDQCAPYIDILIDQFSALREALEKDILKLATDGTSQKQPIYKILIVDDDRTIRLALKDVFKGQEFETTEATSGNEAVELCRRHIPDIILMDAIMADTDGFSACRSIRSMPNCAEIPILIITSLEDDEAITEAFASGATDYITKPLHFTVLKERVSRLLKANKVGKRVQEMAYKDSLTGLPNRARLMQELRVILDRSGLDNQNTAVLFIDLDNFKNINDTLGHNVGDLLLKVVADRLQSSVRETDFIARLGGDEFTVVLENPASKDALAQIAKSICNSLNKPFVFLQKKMFISASIGISIFPEDAKDISTLLKHADLAMFEAKKNKNEYVFYRGGMEDEISRRLEIEQELRHAIEDDQLILHYQPQYDIATEIVVAAETLVRWNHPTRGLLGPNEFIAIAEQSELITDLTKWVIAQVVKQIDIWSRAGQTMTLSINLSGKDLETTGELVNYLTEIVRRYQINTLLIELEITEGILMDDPEQGRRELLQLKDMGFTLAIDDFGTGYSSLNYLKNLPVDILKIDRLFVKDIEKNNDDRAIVKGIIALADSLNLKTIAEGVETEAQRDIISGLGCKIIQGYLISKPIPLDEFQKNYMPDISAQQQRPHLKLL